MKNTLVILISFITSVAVYGNGEEINSFQEFFKEQQSRGKDKFADALQELQEFIQEAKAKGNMQWVIFLEEAKNEFLKLSTEIENYREKELQKQILIMEFQKNSLLSLIKFAQLNNNVKEANDIEKFLIVQNLFEEGLQDFLSANRAESEQRVNTLRELLKQEENSYREQKESAAQTALLEYIQAIKDFGRFYAAEESLQMLFEEAVSKSYVESQEEFREMLDNLDFSKDSLESFIKRASSNPKGKDEENLRRILALLEAFEETLWELIEVKKAEKGNY